MDVFGGRIARLLREADVVLELVNHGIIATWAVPELAEEALQCHQRGWRGRGRSNFRGVLSGRKQADFARSLADFELRVERPRSALPPATLHAAPGPNRTAHVPE